MNPNDDVPGTDDLISIHVSSSQFLAQIVAYVMICVFIFAVCFWAGLVIWDAVKPPIG